MNTLLNLSICICLFYGQAYSQEQEDITSYWDKFDINNLIDTSANCINNGYWHLISQTDKNNIEKNIICPFLPHSINEPDYEFILTGLGTFKDIRKNAINNTKKTLNASLEATHQGFCCNISSVHDDDFVIRMSGKLYIDSLDQIILDIPVIEYKKLIHKDNYNELNQEAKNHLFFDEELMVKQVEEKVFKIEFISNHKIKLINLETGIGTTFVYTNYEIPIHDEYFNWLFIKKLKTLHKETNYTPQIDNGDIIILVSVDLEHKSIDYKLLYTNEKLQNELSILAIESIMEEYLLEYIQENHSCLNHFVFEYPRYGKFRTGEKYQINHELPILKTTHW